MASSRSSVRSAPAHKRLGAEEPRIFTPPLRKLTRQTSAGFECIEFAETVLGIDLFPWQKWILIHALELLPDRTFRFRTVVLLVGRQNGKSTLMQVLSLWRMFVDGAQLVIGTAQNLDVAEEQWQGAIDIVEDIPELAVEVAQVLKVNGKKQLKLNTGERYKVAAASRRGGRGLSGDLVLLDELREHQSWDAWGAVSKTTMARARAQVWAASNAGDSSSVVLAYLREIAHDALGNPDDLKPTTDREEVPDDAAEDDSLGIFEYSAPPDCDIWDRDGWAMANPSMGHGGVSEQAIASAARTDPVPVFRTEVLCQWVDGLLESVIPPSVWEACFDIASKIVSPPRFALDVSPSRAWAAISAAGLRADGRSHVEVTSRDGVADHRQGVDWVIPRVLQLFEAFPGSVLTIASGSAAEALVPALTSAGVELEFIKGNDVAAACGLFFDQATTHSLRHIGQVELTAALLTVRKNIDNGEGAWRWGRKRSGADIAPLYAATLALWSLIASINDDRDPVNNVW